MQFSFWLANHSLVGQRSLEDVIGIMANQLKALGHAAVWDPSNTKLVAGDSGVNVVVEGFSADSIAVMREYRGKGARFIILATEEPTPKGFNHGTQKEMVGRQAMFPEAAALCEGIVHLVPGERVTRWYGQYAPAAYAELGYAQSLMRVTGEEPEYEFGFYGSMTPRRLRMLKRLARYANSQKAVRIVADFATQVERDAAMRQAKVIVQIRKFEPMGLVSSSRCCTALSLGRPVIAEPHELSEPWDKVVRFAESEQSFYTEAMVVRAAWRAVYQGQFDKFKQHLTPQRCIGDALERIGVLPARRAA